MAKGFSPVCVHVWSFRVLARLQEKSHWSHLKGFSPEWVSMWVLRMELCEQEKMHWLQLKYFSPEWESLCLLRSPAWEAEMLHCAQLKAFSPECVSRWRVTWEGRLYMFAFEGFIVPILALLLVVLCRMFFYHMSLESRGLRPWDHETLSN